MSWVASLPEPVDAAGVRECESTSSAGLNGEPREQFEKARELAATLIESGVVGDPANHTFRVSLSGHANPAHVPAEGYANDLVSISVSQA